MTAYYNEIDPYAAQWLRNLIKAGHIAPGYVDERSIEDVRPSDLGGFTQCHFFAGIGVWSLALRRSGWADDRPVWTGSCPCQPFSAAGKGDGFDDERHLWPDFHWLIEQCRPTVVLGEQVASKDADPWIDLVQTDLEGMGYAFGAVPFPSAGVGAPHIRDRLYWVAHASGSRLSEQWRERYESTRSAASGLVGRLANDAVGRRREERPDAGGKLAGDRAQGLAAGSVHGGSAGRVADASNIGLDGWRSSETSNGRDAARVESDRLCDVVGLADANSARPLSGPHAGIHRSEEGAGPWHGESQRPSSIGERSGPTNGYWSDADWLLCRDGKWRPVEPGYEQMVDGSAASLGRVRPSDIEEIQEEVNAWAIRHKTDAGEALCRVWLDLRAQALCEREAGRFSGVQSPPILLAFLRQLTEQGWRFADALAREGAAAPQIIVRVLRFDPGAARTPLRRELAEQLAGQPADPLQELSSILAHHAAQCWGDACRAKARAASFPLAHNAPARVGRLRAYGNAINAIQAQVFIEEVMECLP